jgi:transposase
MLRCSCGEINEGAFPPEARAPVTYGPRVRASGLYLLSRQHLPTERAAEAMADLLGAGALDAFLDEVHRQVRASAVVHFDETPTRVEKAKHYFHVACTELLRCSTSRGACRASSW